MCTLSNINKMAYFYARAQYELLLLVLVGNSDRFRILCSYILLLKSPVLMRSCLWVCTYSFFFFVSLLSFLPPFLPPSSSSSLSFFLSYRLGALDSAVEAYSEALRLDPGFLEGYLGRGNAHMDYLTEQGNGRSRYLTNLLVLYVDTSSSLHLPFLSFHFVLSLNIIDKGLSRRLISKVLVWGYACMSVCNGSTIEIYGFTHSLHFFLVHAAHGTIMMEDLEGRSD